VGWQTGCIRGSNLGSASIESEICGYPHPDAIAICNCNAEHLLAGEGDGGERWELRTSGNQLAARVATRGPPCPLAVAMSCLASPLPAAAIVVVSSLALFHSPCSLILPCPFNHRSVPICSSAYQLSSVDASKHNNVKRALYARSDLANKNTGKNCPRTQGKTTIHRTILHKKLVLITLCSSHLRPGKDLQSSRLTCAAALNSEP